MTNGIAEKQWVGIDLHLHRSVICRIDAAGKQLDSVLIDNDPKALVTEVRKVGRGAPVAIEATYGWYWGSFPEGYIALPELRELRELRELVRHRRQLTKTSTSVKAQIRALLAKHGIRLPVWCLESQAGQDQLDAVVLPPCE